MSALRFNYRMVIAVSTIGLLLAIAGCSEEESDPVDPGTTGGMIDTGQSGSGSPPVQPGTGGTTAPDEPTAGTGGTTTPTGGTDAPPPTTGGTDAPPPTTGGTDAPPPTTGGTDAPPPTGDADGGTGDPDIEACLQSIRDEHPPDGTCEALSFTTPEQMNFRCLGAVFHTVPLTQPLADGSMSYGPVQVAGGPLGGAQLWNQGVQDIADADTADFRNTINAAELVCNPIGIDTFAEPFEITDDLKNLREMNQEGYTVYLPACMKEGEKYPLITWANGTCGYTHGYSVLLSSIAAYGYVIVASNSTWTGGTAGYNGITVQINAINYAEAINELPNHPLYQRIDLANIGAMGHSQGAGATAANAGDSRIKAIILWNNGTSNIKPFLNVSGERDMGDPGVDRFPSSTLSASQPGAYLYHQSVLHTTGHSTGHLVNMMQPDRCVRFAVRWWDYWLKGDMTAKEEWMGDCDFCEAENDGLDDGQDHCSCGVNSAFESSSP